MEGVVAPVPKSSEIDVMAAARSASDWAALQADPSAALARLNASQSVGSLEHWPARPRAVLAPAQPAGDSEGKPANSWRMRRQSLTEFFRSEAPLFRGRVSHGGPSGESVQSKPESTQRL